MTPDELRRVRKHLGLTQSKFAVFVGVHLVTVKKWETGALGMKNTTEGLIRLLAKQRVKGLSSRRPPKATRRRKAR